MKITVQNIMKGDQFRNPDDPDTGWNALEGADITKTGLVNVAIQHVPDGGRTLRTWDDKYHMIEITRTDR